MMRKSFLSLATLLSTVISATAFAGGNICPPQAWWQNIYAGIEGGYSISSSMNFQPDYDANGTATWITFEHSIFNTNMGTSPLIGGLIGYTLNQNVSADVSYDYRGDYDWDRISTLDGLAGDPTQQVGERYVAHNIRIHTLLFGVNLAPSVQWGGFVPYVTAGIGAAWNRIGSFENMDIPTPSRHIPQTFDTVLDGNTTTNFAWKAGAGVDYSCTNHPQWHFNLGYRFVDVGTLKTGTTFVDSLRQTQGTINPFRADHVQLNEITAGLIYHFV